MQNRQAVAPLAFPGGATDYWRQGLFADVIGAATLMSLPHNSMISQSDAGSMT
jgi:hypothetical protein